MTRINLVAPSELCDQHLLAEHRELKRIPNMVVKGWRPTDIPEKFCLGKGHVKFFANKLAWLFTRYYSLHEECLNRGFEVKLMYPPLTRIPDHLYNNYTPTEEDIALSRQRIKEKMPANPRFTKYI